MRRKLAFVGHAFHTRTRSSTFLSDQLSQKFDVTVMPVDPARLDEFDFAVVDDFDMVLLHQLDFLGPIFLSRGLPTVITPMFDGSEHMPNAHWAFLNQARFVAFSRQLHVNMQRAGANSLLVKYFPEPKSTRRDLSALRGFFWERRPDTGINSDLLGRLVGSQLDHLHIHQAPDMPTLTPTQPDPTMFPSVSLSQWFEKKSQMEEILAECNVYIAPRLSEGIGMGFLEAMANGMMVMAHDSSTHNEYIANWENGVLFNLNISNPPSLSLDLVNHLGEAARQTVVEGHKAWVDKIPEMIDWIEEAPKPQSGIVDPDEIKREVPKAYLAGFGSYLNYLKRNGPLVRKFSPGLQTRNPKSAMPSVDGSDDELAIVPALSTTALALGTSEARPYLAAGFSKDEPGFVWVDGTSASIKFGAAESLTMMSDLVLFLHRPGDLPDQEVAVTINGTLCGSFKVGSEPERVTLPLPENWLKRFNEVRIFCSRAKTPGADPRSLSVALSGFAFE